MRMRGFCVPAVLAAGGLMMSLSAVAADQTQPGAGNARAEQIGGAGQHAAERRSAPQRPQQRPRDNMPLHFAGSFPNPFDARIAPDALQRQI